MNHYYKSLVEKHVYPTSSHPNRKRFTHSLSLVYLYLYYTSACHSIFFLTKRSKSCFNLFLANFPANQSVVLVWSSADEETTALAIKQVIYHINLRERHEHTQHLKTTKGSQHHSLEEERETQHHIILMSFLWYFIIIFFPHMFHEM